MTRLEWGVGPKPYDLGIDHGVLYLGDSAVPWNGLVSVDERNSGTVNADYYFEGNRLSVTQDTGDFEAVISAYTYPDIFAEYNGYGPKDDYQRFGLSYRTQHGQDYKLHIVYNVLVRDDARQWKSIAATIDPSLFSWDIYAAAIPIPNAAPASHLTMELPYNDQVFADLEDILYGTDTTDARLPDPAELVELYESATRLRIIYNGDGTYTAIGPDDMVHLLPNGDFELTAPSVFLMEQDIFVVNSY